MSELHHTIDEVCPLCAEKLKQAHPTLVSLFNEIIKPNFQDCHISWTFRGQADQEKAFKDGKSKLHFPLSSHNKSDDLGNPCALAVDLFKLGTNGAAVWPPKYFQQIYDVLQENDVHLRWGAIWKSLGDSDHFELGN